MKTWSQFLKLDSKYKLYHINAKKAVNSGILGMFHMQPTPVRQPGTWTMEREISLHQLM